MNFTLQRYEGLITFFESYKWILTIGVKKTYWRWGYEYWEVDCFTPFWTFGLGPLLTITSFKDWK